jgi:2,3-bisphosphoglycerate-independent phosphoglycerate mutase
MARLLRHPAFASDGKHGPRAVIASVTGRYFAMDRDKRWDRVAKAYAALTGQCAATPVTPVEAIEKSYENGKTDEFMEPVLLDAGAAILDHDAVIFFNYRSDRAREISEAFTAKEFSHFDRGKPLLLASYAGMTQYDPKLELPFAFAPQNLDHIFGEWLEERGLYQFRTAETEKYAHVTFFFNGGREKPFEREDRSLVASPKDVATYDLKPEMSAFQVASEAASRISLAKYDFVLMNFANADMVGHTGNYEAAIRAMEALDKCLAQVVGAAEKAGYHTLITADHGNAEEMRDAHGEIHTQHTLNPVPAIWVSPGSSIAPRTERKAMRDGTLADIMPTLCGLMNLPVPAEVSGKSLLPGGA